MTRWSRANRVYLSPHLDDAALSCGGAIFQQVEAGDHVLVVNVFAGQPDHEPLSAFAQEKHAVWGGPDDVVATRRAEDEAALAILGAGAVYWECQDAIYRQEGARHLYRNEAAIFGDVDPAERDLARELAGEAGAILEHAESAVCYAPLGIGHHVDHLVVRDVGLTLWERGYDVSFYEDFPYVWWEARDGTSRDATVPSAVEHLGQWEPETRAVEIGPKIAAIACYESQMADLFDTKAAMAEAVQSYARAVGDSGYAERFWRIRR